MRARAYTPLDVEDDRIAKLYGDLKVPANIEAYVDVLGVEDAVAFFLAFGGAEVYFAKSPTLKSAAAEQIGIERMIALGAQLAYGNVRVPTAKQFVAEVMLRQGKGIAEIARTLHMDESRIRRWLGPKPISRQLSLFND